MFLKCIEMTGFKSFPEKTLMHMNGSITGVVGPNGSGKSNVSDAVRWVLGEQSAKSLRGTVMQDVIFVGTQKRKSRSFCEVSLIFDNSDQKMSSAYTEIQVTRKLYRSGESEYYINNTKCRLKDILNMFRDTGIGKEGYSIIGQGRIDEILSEKSLDRRRVFEEASGIMKYRVRKEEAERKLERTRSNLLRIEDILQEQGRRIGPLKHQANGAMEYLDLSKTLKELEINLFLHHYDTAKERIAKLTQSKQALFEEREHKEQTLKERSKQLSEEQENVRDLERTGDELAGKLSRCFADVERVEGEIRLCEERIANLDKDSERIEQEIEDSNRKTDTITQTEARNRERVKQVEKELEECQRIVQETGKELLTLGSAVEDRVKIIEMAQGEKVKTIEKMADLKSAVSALNEKEQNILQRIGEISERLAALAQEQADNDAALSRLNETLSVSRQQSQELLSTINEKTYLKTQLTGQIDEDQKRLEAVRRESATCASSVALLRDMKNNYEGYLTSVKRLMVAAKENSDIGGRIVGTFADVISVPSEYEKAIEMCLGVCAAKHCR